MTARDNDDFDSLHILKDTTQLFVAAIVGAVGADLIKCISCKTKFLISYDCTGCSFCYFAYFCFDNLYCC
jgi:hypothetical protein